MKGRSWPFRASEGGGLLRPLRGSDYRSEKNFDLNLFQVILVDFEYLVKSLLMDRLLRLLKDLVLTFHHRRAHGAFTFFVAVNACL
jgi:hypothetical protein